MTIKWAADINMGRLVKFVKGELPPGDNAQEAVNLLDIILRHYASTIPGCEPVTRGWYLQSLFSRTPQDRDLSGGAEAWNGLRLSMRPGVKSIFLNADLATSAFLTPGPAITVLQNIVGRNVKLDRELPAGAIERANSTLKNVRIHLTDFRQTGRKKYNIGRLSKEPASRCSFERTVDGTTTKVTIPQFFQETYNKRLQYPNLPCFEVGGGSRKILIPIELCEIPAGQTYRKKLDDVQTAKMIRIAQQRPIDRLNRTSQGVNQLVGPAREGQDFRENDYLKAFNVKLAKDMLTVNARILPPPVVAYNPSSRAKEVIPRDGVWNMKDRKVARGMALHSWSVLIFAPEPMLPRSAVTTFVKKLVEVCKATGMEIQQEEPTLRYGRDANVEDNLNASFRDAGENCRKRPQMILVILPDTNPRRYAEIKRVSDTVLGVITQCMQAKHVGKAAAQYCANLCLKINVKLGGFNAFLPAKAGPQGQPQLPFISEAPTLVLGADIVHPGPGEGNTRPSIAAMVGSLDAQCARFAATLRIQRAQGGRQRSDIIQDIYGMTTELLRSFYKEAKTKPRRIVIYRDGASEGQFREIRLTEIAAMRRACEDIDRNAAPGQPPYRPPITFIVVTKRHGTRMFPKRKEDADQSGNVMPGTIIDTNIVHPKEWDFYLNSHSGLQGTSRSAHYHVLHDDNKFTADKLQEMTYRLCYLYARCTRSVSVCPPIYYADLVAARARAHFKGMEWGSEDDTTSVSSAAQEDASKVWVERFATVHKDLAQVMYYM
ncbi:Piwi domain-containing protein [Fimicolochytrium jonesii]|uniref:Piwi domain-containing protein n=1 Tax=Fimicolochytrium jonesii TaxID=1396493 RepID=UPI0022FF3B61|nr:Piwi domain-containing protein [Fimicolochytrium jonesii]KAI8816009.1 Piwi domain-containing protein [Fimicolochytrium jonesii]